MSDASTPRSLIERLACFNAKERWWLLRHMLGAPSLHPDRTVIADLARSVGFPVPLDAAPVFAAIDYHLSWLHAALSDQLPQRGMQRADWRKNVPMPQRGTATLRHAVENSQEDLDFIVAYEHPLSNELRPTTYMLLIEAKGVTDFHEKQNASKLPRLAGILRHAMRDRWDHPEARTPIQAALVFLSPGVEQHQLLDQARAIFGDTLPAARIVWKRLPLKSPDPAGFWYTRLSDETRERWTIGWRTDPSPKGD